MIPPTVEEASHEIVKAGGITRGRENIPQPSAEMAGPLTCANDEIIASSLREEPSQQATENRSADSECAGRIPRAPPTGSGYSHQTARRPRLPERNRDLFPGKASDKWVGGSATNPRTARVMAGSAGMIAWASWK